jgi:tetratricopeptide (TPR) repeat protein
MYVPNAGNSEEEKEKEKESNQLRDKGNENFKKKDFKNAIYEYSKAILLTPRDLRLYSNRSLCYRAQEMFHLSLEDSKKALELDPNSTKAMWVSAIGLSELAKAEKDHSKVKEAMILIKKALEKVGDDAIIKKTMDQISKLDGLFNKRARKQRDGEIVKDLEALLVNDAVLHSNESDSSLREIAYSYLETLKPQTHFEQDEFLCKITLVIPPSFFLLYFTFFGFSGGV